MAEETKIIAEKMQKAFDEFVAQMGELQKRANDLVLKSLQSIDKEKIAAVLADIKKLTK
jgi:hypothetical protein